ncbi:MAG: type II toxin-antitoxin system RelE/ParE family toxin [Actinomycetota bacterium]
MELSPAAARAFRKLPDEVRTRLRKALTKLANDAAAPGRVSGKRVKTIQGTGDSFHRLRVGDYRIMYDVVNPDRVILVLGVIHRGDIERWIRNR